MAAPLPGNIRLKLEQTLAQWRHWDCQPPLPHRPTVEAVLTEGRSNYSVLVAAKQRFVVRLDGINPAANGLNRQSEWRSLQTAHSAGIAPRPRYFNPDLGALVCDYLPTDTAQPVDAPEVGRLLQAIHTLPARRQRLHLAERILSYEKRLAHRKQPLLSELLRRGQAVTQVLELAQQSDTQLVLCHNDLLQANRIYSANKLWAIDWEYCAMGSPWYDLAVVIAGDTLDEQATAQLLYAYLGRSPSPAEQVLVRQYACTYRYLELLWYLALDETPLTETDLQARLDQLDFQIGQTPH